MFGIFSKYREMKSEVEIAKRELARMLCLVYPDIEPLPDLLGLVSQIDNGFAVPLLQQRSGLTTAAPDLATHREQLLAHPGDAARIVRAGITADGVPDRIERVRHGRLSDV